MPPLDFPTDSNVLFHVSYSLDSWDLTLAEGDSIVFELSVDGGNTFEKLQSCVPCITRQLSLIQATLSFPAMPGQSRLSCACVPFRTTRKAGA